MPVSPWGRPYLPTPYKDVYQRLLSIQAACSLRVRGAITAALAQSGPIVCHRIGCGWTAF